MSPFDELEMGVLQNIMASWLNPLVEIRRRASDANRLGVETIDEMTDRLIAARVRQHFAAGSADE